MRQLTLPRKNLPCKTFHKIKVGKAFFFTFFSKYLLHYSDRKFGFSISSIVTS